MKGIDFILRGATVAAFALILYSLIKIAAATNGEYHVLKEMNGIVLSVEITLAAIIVAVTSLLETDD